MVNRVGTVEPRQLAYASGVLTAIPEPLKTLAYEPFGARAIVLALLVDRDSGSVAGLAARATQAVHRAGAGRRGRGDPAARAFPEPELRLPLVSMAVPALRRLSRDQFEAFAAGVRELIQADNQVSLYEYALHRLSSTPGPSLGFRPAAAERGQVAGTLAGPVRHVLGALAQFGSAGRRTPPVRSTWESRPWDGPGWTPRLPAAGPGPPGADRLNDLDAAAPPLKHEILNACAACIGADGRVTLEEGELLRAIADSLGCPMPPLQSLAGIAPDGDDRTSAP